jgi:hypothetical protein
LFEVAASSLFGASSMALVTLFSKLSSMISFALVGRIGSESEIASLALESDVDGMLRIALFRMSVFNCMEDQNFVEMRMGTIVS